MKPTRWLVILSFILLSAIAGAVFGGPRLAAKGEDLDDSLKSFSSLLGLIEENYADTVDSDKAVYGAIDGMLRTLDPHSRFIDPKSFASEREDQRGKYYGLGISIATRFGKVTIVSPPVSGSPAEKVGFRVGDVITHVNGVPTTGMDQNAVVSKLRGPRGTSVTVRVKRPGIDEPLELMPVRDEIAKFTISQAFMVRPRIGYIKLDSFAETSGDELRDALRKLGPRNMDGLVFDLRGNPGGVLPAAIEVSETFLQKGQLILETRGRTRGASVKYASQKTNSENLFPLVVLVNSTSASASEIVSGAIQDHDRGLIVGETSFGKGLVQTVYSLHNNAGLALTTQKWYTPSGRLIQRDYSQISQFDYYNRRETAQGKNGEIKHSDLGRIVYGGGGITPDYAVEPSKSNEFQEDLAGHYVFYTFVRSLLAAKPTITPAFQVTDTMLQDFRQHLKKRDVEFAESDFQANTDFIKRMIRYEAIYDTFGALEAAKTLLEGDPQVLKAIDLIPDAKDLAGKTKRQIANR